MNNTAILMTPAPAPGGSAIAVIRLRGPGVGEFLTRCFSKKIPPGRCVHGELRDGESLIDDPVAVVAQDGSWVDICLHGGAWVIESALDLARRRGFQIVPAGTSPLPDAALDDENPILQKEVLAHLPMARTEQAIRMLLDQPTAWRRAIDAGLNVRAILQDQTLWRLLNPPKIAIVGAANVGKSTLANRLFGTQRSITADMPGTTRDWVGEMADIAGMAALLLDTPGQRHTADAIERSAIAASRAEIESSDLAITLLDATTPPEMPVDFASGIVAINKIDLSAGWDFRSSSAVQISARTGGGVDELCRQIHRRLGVERLSESAPRWWTARQKNLLAESIEDPSAVAKIVA